MSRYLTAAEKGWSDAERLVSLVGWGLRRFSRYAMWVPEIHVSVPWPQELAWVMERSSQLRLRAMLVELACYRVTWVEDHGVWGLEGPLVELPTRVPDVAVEEAQELPTVQHEGKVLRRPAGVERGEVVDCQEGVASLWFDGGSAGKLGTGGFVVWDGSGRLLTA